MIAAMLMGCSMLICATATPGLHATGTTPPDSSTDMPADDDRSSWVVATTDSRQPLRCRKRSRSRDQLTAAKQTKKTTIFRVRSTEEATARGQRAVMITAKESLQCSGAAGCRLEHRQAPARGAPGGRLSASHHTYLAWWWWQERRIIAGWLPSDAAPADAAATAVGNSG